MISPGLALYTASPTINLTHSGEYCRSPKNMGEVTSHLRHPMPGKPTSLTMHFHLRKQKDRKAYGERPCLSSPMLTPGVGQNGPGRKYELSGRIVKVFEIAHLYSILQSMLNFVKCIILNPKQHLAMCLMSVHSLRTRLTPSADAAAWRFPPSVCCAFIGTPEPRPGCRASRLLFPV